MMNDERLTPTRSISVGCDDGRFIFPKECEAKGELSAIACVCHPEEYKRSAYKKTV